MTSGSFSESFVTEYVDNMLAKNQSVIRVPEGLLGQVSPALWRQTRQKCEQHNAALQIIRSRRRLASASRLKRCFGQTLVLECILCGVIGSAGYSRWAFTCLALAPAFFGIFWIFRGVQDRRFVTHYQAHDTKRPSRYSRNSHRYLMMLDSLSDFQVPLEIRRAMAFDLSYWCRGEIDDAKKLQPASRANEAFLKVLSNTASTIEYVVKWGDDEMIAQEALCTLLSLKGTRLDELIQTVVADLYLHSEGRVHRMAAEVLFFHWESEVPLVSHDPKNDGSFKTLMEALQGISKEGPEPLRAKATIVLNDLVTGHPAKKCNVCRGIGVSTLRTQLERGEWFATGWRWHKCEHCAGSGARWFDPKRPQFLLAPSAILQMVGDVLEASELGFIKANKSKKQYKDWSPGTDLDYAQLGWQLEIALTDLLRSETSESETLRLLAWARDLFAAGSLEDALESLRIR